MTQQNHLRAMCWNGLASANVFRCKQAVPPKLGYGSSNERPHVPVVYDEGLALRLPGNTLAHWFARHKPAGEADINIGRDQG